MAEPATSRPQCMRCTDTSCLPWLQATICTSTGFLCITWGMHLGMGKSIKRKRQTRDSFFDAAAAKDTTAAATKHAASATGAQLCNLQPDLPGLRCFCLNTSNSSRRQLLYCRIPQASANLPAIWQRNAASYLASCLASLLAAGLPKRSSKQFCIVRSNGGVHTPQKHTKSLSQQHATS